MFWVMKATQTRKQSRVGCGLVSELLEYGYFHLCQLVRSLHQNDKTHATQIAVSDLNPAQNHPYVDPRNLTVRLWRAAYPRNHWQLASDARSLSSHTPRGRQ